jgi:2-methylcitrate dehydratase PrpD
MNTATLSASEKIARFVVGFNPDAVSPKARHVISRAVYDTLVSALAGTNEPASRNMLAYARSQSGAGPATVWSTGERLSLEYAALVNGTMGHALDYDDVSSPLRGHPSVAMLPALLALGESLGISGRALVDAFAVGFEVTLKFARAIVDDQYAKGWHSTASIATFGATAACARLLNLDVAAFTHAIGIAVSQIAGTRQNFGTMSKAFQAGLANAVALRSVLLARAGVDASRVALDGSHGYTVLYADGQDIHAQLDTLGTLPLEIERAGIEVKKYPLCYATHRAIDGVLDLVAAHGIGLHDVVRMDVRANYRAMVQLIYHRPRTGLEGKFSMEYAVAAALHDGHVNLASFTDAAVQRPALQAFFEKVHLSEGEPPMFPRWTEISIQLRDGRLLPLRIDRLRGSAEQPLTDAELIRKGSDCCAHGRSSVSAERLAGLCFAVDELTVSELMAAFSDR